MRIHPCATRAKIALSPSPVAEQTSSAFSRGVLDGSTSIKDAAIHLEDPAAAGRSLLENLQVTVKPASPASVLC